MALVALVAAGAVPCRIGLSLVTAKTSLWKVTGDDRLRTEFGLVNRIDKNIKQHLFDYNLTTNPFRYKFIMVNREWIINNLAMILGGRVYLSKYG